ncbi:unnamed protein product [Brassica rapa]|uniref:Uncharacterized protein n=2 Tax=Brassica TaxID=3705 RepID=A0A8D9MBD1_BRACM|nr:unnamed protein product [Brassica napus]CAG7905872.1 unnamed protein product [Brassica rapa]
MEGVEVINGLGCKMSCSSYKVNSESILKPNWYEILYVLDTEDFFHRKKKHKKKSENLAHDKSSSQQCNFSQKLFSAYSFLALQFFSEEKEN